MSDHLGPPSMAAWFPTFRRILYWRVWRLWRVPVYLLLVALLLGALASIVGNIHYGGKVRAELRALKAAGKPVTTADIPPPPVPEAQNAAPLYRTAAQIVRAHQVGTASELPRDARAPSPPVNAQRPFGYRDAAWHDPQVAACLADLVQQDGEALNLLRQASARPGYRSATDYSDPLGAAFPQFQEARSLAYFLAAAAVVASREGNAEEALDRLRMGYLLGRRLSEEPVVMAVRVVSMTDLVLSQALAYVLAHAPAPAEEAAELADEIARLDYGDFSQRAWQGERAWLMDACALARQDRLREALTEEPPGTRERLLWWGYAYSLRPILYADQLAALRHMAAQEPLLAAPPHQRARMPRPAAAVQLPLWQHPISAALLPSFPGVPAGGDAAQAVRNLARIALGLELNRQQHGSYPASLLDLRRAGWTVPSDPYTGRDPLYRSRGSAFVLYCVGPDGDDDGGTALGLAERPRTLRAERVGARSESGDVVWGR